MHPNFNRTSVLVLLAIFGCFASGFGQGSPNVVLLAHMNKYPTAGYSSNWGYTAPDGREYALEGVQTGTSIVDITDPANLREVAFIPGSTSAWREIKTYQHYAYVVNETGGGMQIIDMSNLPVSATLVATYTALATAHTLWIDEASGILYAEGNSTQPVKVISLANPISPVQIGFFGIECHDIVVQNNIAYISEGTRGSYGLYDVSTPAAAVRLGTVNAPAPAGYAHNCWPSPNGQYLMTTEENTGETVKMYDISNLSSPILTDQYLGGSNLAHNVYIRENFSYIAHYADGLKVVDISNPFNIFEVGFYDTNPATGGFNGAWNIYPFFPSGKIALSDIQNGVWVFFFDDGSQKPTITSTPGTSATVGQPYSYDPDNLVNVLGTPVITFSFTGPGGFNVNSSTGAVSWTPNAGQIGTHPVSITATNAFGTNTQNFNITVSSTPGYTARINAGGANFTDGSGNLYVADQAYTAGSFGFVGGSTSSFTNSIGGTTDDPLYQTLRRTGGSPSFSYRFDVPAGNYDVTLHFMAPAVGTGNFMIDVLAEGSVVFNDLDINAEAGGTFQALIKAFSASVSDGTLDLNFVTVNKQALVCAIAVVAQTGTPAPEIDVSPVSVNFGNVTVSQNADQNVTINNVGTATLTVNALNITNSVFSLVSPPLVPFNIGPGGSQVLTVRFSPVAAGAQAGNLAISSNDADEPTVNVGLSGTGVTPSLYTARINSGGPNFTTGGGLLFVADQAYNPPSATFGFVGGVSGTNSSAIANTNDDPLYQAFRRSATTAGASFQYNFDVPSGTYSVTLHLAAPNAGGGGSFVMTVQAEGANVPSLTNFDINAQAGGMNTALSVSFSQVVTDGTLNLNFVRVNKTSIVSGIEVVQTAGPSMSKSAASNAAALAKAPAGFKLHPNHPNPFNPATRIRYEIPRAMSVTLKIYNMLGEEIRTLVAAPHSAGSYEVEWDGRQNSGIRAPSGVYLYRLQGEGINEARKMLLVQ